MKQCLQCMGNLSAGNLFRCIDVVAFEFKFNLSYASLSSKVIKYVNKDYSKELIIIHSIDKGAMPV